MTDTLTFLGHASFKITRSSGEVFWMDPWLRENPACPSEFHTLERADLVFITHGHGDHFDLEAVDQAAALGATFIAPAPIRNFLNARGVHSPRVAPMNKGGNVVIHGVRVNMTLAHHHAHIDTDGEPGWFHEAVGYVLDLGQTRITLPEIPRFLETCASLASCTAPPWRFYLSGTYSLWDPSRPLERWNFWGSNRSFPSTTATYSRLPERSKRLKSKWTHKSKSMCSSRGTV